jgi:2-dehydropantoate 2-reductase
MNIIVFGAGMQGTLYAVRLAQAGHEVTLIARGRRSEELRGMGAVIQNLETGTREAVNLPVLEEVPENLRADFCFVFVRREQIDAALDDLIRAKGVDRIVWMVNHACGSEPISQRLGCTRTVLGFPGTAGAIQDGIDRYVDIPEQATVVEASAPEVAKLLRAAGFRTQEVRDMDAWLKRHAVMITAIGCAILARDGSAYLVGADRLLVKEVILAIREGWRALDGLQVAAASLRLRMIFVWIPLSISTRYWSGLLGDGRGEIYFAQHTRRSICEIRALAKDVTMWVSNPNDAQHLYKLYSVL